MKEMQYRLFRLLSGIVMIVLATPAFSQNSDFSENTLHLDEMTVTAEKREEKIQDVPITISAYSETTLEDAGVDEVRDVTVMVPNLDMTDYNGWGYQANFRGMNYSSFTNKLPMVMYIDNVPYDEGNTFVGDFNNVERIEVLRGAHGTLYGQNALAGIINIISKTPGNEPEGKVTIEAGEYETYGVKAYYNGPLIQDKLFFGFSGSYDETAGWLENDHPDEETSGGGKTTRAKGRLRWKASNSLTADLSMSAYQYRNQGTIGSMISGSEYKNHEYRDPDDDIHHLDSNQIALDLTYATGGFDIKSITTQRSTSKKWVKNSTFIVSILGRGSDISETDTMTQEFRIQSKEGSSGMKWLAGLFFMNEEKDRKEYGTEFLYPALYQSLGIYSTYTYQNYPADQTTSSQSVFAQVTFPVAEKMELTAGARYETIEKTMDYVMEVTDTYGSSGSSFDGTTLLPTTTYSVSSDWSAFLPRAVLSYKMNPDDMVFFSYSMGYLPGGFNMSESDKTKADFDAQYSTTYEMGAKTAWMNNSLIFNATVFHTDITDMHVFEVLPNNSYIASNAGKARSQGAEIEVAVKPVTGLELAAAVGVVDCNYVDYDGYDGNDIAGTPDFTAYFSGKYRGNTGIYFGGSIEGHGDAWTDDANTVKNEGYWIANTRVGYEAGDWDVYLNVENLTDTEYLENVLASSGMEFSTVGKPRTISIIASTRF